MSTSTKSEWNYYTHIWKTESAYLSWIRGQIRQIWNTCPQKIEFLKKNVKQLPKLDENGDEIKFKNGKVRLYKSYVCNYCDKVCYDSEKIANKKTYAVDHVKGNHSLTKFEHIPTFLDAIVRVREEDLQILCKSCHDIKTYAETQNITFKAAIFQKEAIKLLNEKQDKQFFTDRNLPIPKNAELRREQIVEILEKELNPSKVTKKRKKNDSKDTS